MLALARSLSLGVMLVDSSTSAGELDKDRGIDMQVLTQNWQEITQEDVSVCDADSR